MPALNEITPQQLLRLIGTPNCPAIVDISIDPDFAEDPHLIPNSFRHSHNEITGLIERLDGQKSVIICQKGIKLSQGMAAQLRSKSASLGLRMTSCSQPLFFNSWIKAASKSASLGNVMGLPLRVGVDVFGFIKDITFIVITCVDAFHIDRAVVNFIGQGLFE